MKRTLRSWIITAHTDVALILLVFATVLAGCSPGEDGEDAIGQAEASTIVGDGGVDVRSFGAVGDGRHDDTAAIQAAISAGVGMFNPGRVIFFPVGTYLVTKPLTWQRNDGTWSAGMTLRGQGSGQTSIRLADRAAGFGDPRRPTPVIATGSQNSADGTGNQAFGNYLFDLTVDVGASNPGAIGIDYLASNRGAIRNVVVRAAAGSGSVGIAMQRRWPGPCLIEGVDVLGFDRGVVVAQGLYSVTIDGMRLYQQRTVGLDVSDNVVTARRLITGGETLSVRNRPSGSNGARPGLLTLVDANLGGRDGSGPAIENLGNALLRNISTNGHSGPLTDGGKPVALAPRQQWSSAPAPAGTSGDTLGLVPPAFPSSAPGTPGPTVAAATTGAAPDDGKDDTAALQKALNSGVPVVSLRPGTYQISDTLFVPPGVIAIAGSDAVIDATRGRFAGQSTDAAFSVTGGSTAPVIFAQLRFQASLGVVDVNRTGTRPIEMRDIHIGGRPFQGGPGDLFLTDVEGGQGWSFTPGQRVWARQFDVEQPFTKITATGASVWILGLKTERAGTIIDARTGSSVEVLGGFYFPAGAVPAGQPAFVAQDSRLSLSGSFSAIRPDYDYTVLVRSSAGGGPPTDVPMPDPGTGTFPAATVAP